MSAQRPARKVPSPIDAGERSPSPNAWTDPESPLERNPLSPKGWKKRESDGVGLGILAKMGPDRSGCSGNRPAKLFNVTAAAPIAIWPSRAVNAGRSSQWVCKEKGSAAAASEGDFPVAEFLSCCYLCRKGLHGQDIYMYRGEKAFCSMECRYQQILCDESMEKYEAKFVRWPDVTSSSCSGDGGSSGGCGRGQLFFTEIRAA